LIGIKIGVAKKVTTFSGAMPINSAAVALLRYFSDLTQAALSSP
jgi:hypothetical protein